MPLEPSSELESIRFEATAARLTKQANDALKGRRIQTVFYLSPADTGLDQGGPAIVLDNGTVLVIQSDDEGNAPGAIQVISASDSDPGFIIPRI